MSSKATQRAAGAVFGILLAAVLAVCGYGLYLFSAHLFPSLDTGQVPWLSWITVIALPELVFIAIVVSRWRTNRSVAVGILLSGTVLVVHFALHIASHWAG